jgi:LuxR family transcriptional regulator, maltose regulon positive regulatory protein
VPSGGGLATLGVPRGGPDDQFLPLLINGLGELPGRMVVILDDVHEPSDPRILAGLEFLIRHAPPQLRLVLATRANPALPVARLRPEGTVTEVRVADLAFSRTEAAELLAGLQEPLSDSDVTALWTRTEGWAAGLRLAFLSLQGHPDPTGFVAAFSGDDRTVADYLLSEVLARQPAEDRNFLLDTSVADELTGELADAITGRQDSARQLAELERTSAFVAAIDPRRTWYRYHRLFAELLRVELRHQRSSNEVAELHRRAAHWHAGSRVTEKAVRHALAAEDWEFSAALLAERWALLTAESSTILRALLDLLPPELVEGDAELAMIAAENRLEVNGDLAGADFYLGLVEMLATSVPSDRQARFAAGWALGRLHRARVAADLDGVRAGASQLLARAPTLHGTSRWFVSADGLRLFGLSNLATAELWMGELEAATGHLEDALSLAGTMTSTAAEEFAELNCLSQLALVEVATGQLRRAAERGQEAVAFAERRGWSRTMQAFGGHLALAWATYQRDNLGAAEEHLERATQAARERTAMLAAALVRSWMLASTGKPNQGLTVLRGAVDAVQDAAGWRPPLVLSGRSSGC